MPAKLEAARLDGEDNKFRNRHDVFCGDFSLNESEEDMKTKEPVHPVWQFPPQGTVASHKVKTGDNWWKLASKYGFTASWSIIEFNYQTRTPEIVNWYLERFVGCTKSNDGINYSFDSSDSHGIIYIPSKNWKPVKREDYTEPLSDVVMGAVNGFYDTKLPYVRSSSLEHAFGKIFVVGDPNLTTQVEYNYNSIIFLRVPKNSSRRPPYDHMMLVKEVCHFAYGKHGLNIPFSARTEAVSLLCGRAYYLSRPEWKKLPYSPTQLFRSTPQNVANATLDKFLSDYAKNSNTADLAPIARMVEREPYFMQRLHGHWPRGAAKAA